MSTRAIKVIVTDAEGVSTSYNSVSAAAAALTVDSIQLGRYLAGKVKKMRGGKLDGLKVFYATAPGQKELVNEPS